VVRVKVSRGIEPFSPMGVDSVYTNQPSNGEICMDKSHLLPFQNTAHCSLICFAKHVYKRHVEYERRGFITADVRKILFRNLLRNLIFSKII
jgi:hypothetical protein